MFITKLSSDLLKIIFSIAENSHIGEARTIKYFDVFH